jgi:hypothetical protein
MGSYMLTVKAKYLFLMILYYAVRGDHRRVRMEVDELSK